MNKLLPILLVVVLSGCSNFSDEYTYIDKKHKFTVYLAISDREMLLETPSTNVYDIVEQTDSKVKGKLQDSSDSTFDYILRFHKKLLTLEETTRSGSFFYKCKSMRINE